MSEGKRESLLSRRQRVAIWVIVALLTLWISTYLGLRVGGSRPDPLRQTEWAWWSNFELEDSAPIWHRYAPDFPAKSLVKERQASSIAVPENALSWNVVFHPLQKLEYIFTGRRVYLIDRETRAATGRIHIGATADF